MRDPNVYAERFFNFQVEHVFHADPNALIPPYRPDPHNIHPTIAPHMGSSAYVTPRHTNTLGSSPNFPKSSPQLGSYADSPESHPQSSQMQNGQVSPWINQQSKKPRRPAGQEGPRRANTLGSSPYVHQSSPELGTYASPMSQPQSNQMHIGQESPWMNQQPEANPARICPVPGLAAITPIQPADPAIHQRV